MKRFLLPLLSLALLAILNVSGAENPELAKLQGKWECKKEENGQQITLTMEIKADKLTFRMEGGFSFIATADLKLDNLGPFKAFTSKNIKVGATEDALQDVSEEFAHVYQVHEGKLYVTSNFDQQRERAPALDIYRKVTSSSK